MEKMWTGRFAKALDKKADDFNSSISVDCRMFEQDIRGSIAHATMLVKQGILPQADLTDIIDGLTGILEDIQTGKLPIDENAEDIHMFIEGELTARIGDAGKRLHTARSRNDQVAVDIRLYLRDKAQEVVELIRALIAAIVDKAEENAEVIAPGYTHLQRAQPISFGHHFMAYAMMLLRDIGRIEDGVKRMNDSPLGSCALAGTTYPTDRAFTARALGFDGVMQNSIDGVADRDFCVELTAAFSLLMTHLSRFAEEIILWSSWEFKFIELDDSYTTGSSIMPQKKKPDMAELVRGKTGRVYGDLITLLTMLKGLTAATGMDALTHAIEGYITKGAWEMTDMFHLKAIELISKSLRGAVENTKEGREGMVLGQYVAGMGFSNVGLGIVHSMAHSLGAVCDTPHGVANAILLPTVMEYNAECTGEKYRDIAKAMGVESTENMTQEEYRKAAVDAVRQLSKDVGIPQDLKAIVKDEDVDFLSQSAMDDACRPGNPKDPTLEDIKALYRSLM